MVTYWANARVAPSGQKAADGVLNDGRDVRQGEHGRLPTIQIAIEIAIAIEIEEPWEFDFDCDLDCDKTIFMRSPRAACLHFRLGF
jgi:hypothetical protein